MRGLDVRQLCNVAWAVQVEAMDEKEFKKFTRELHADPTQGPVSHGTKELMGLFGGPMGKPPARTDGKPKVNPDRKAPASGR